MRFSKLFRHLLILVPLPAFAQAELFEEGVFSTSKYELTTTFTPDGRTAYFTVSTPDYGRHYWILESRLVDGVWTAPVTASFSGRYSDADPFISPDGSELYYISKRPVEGAEPKADFDMWRVERRGDGWSDPIHLGDDVNSDANELYPTVTADGTLYFAAPYEGGEGASDIYRSERVNGGYAAPENLGAEVNSEHWDSTPYVAPDESYVVFASWNPEGHGNADLYISERRDGKWTPARNLGPLINSSVRDYCPIVSRGWLYFTSTRAAVVPVDAEFRAIEQHLHSAGNGLGDVYRVRMDDILSGKSP